MSIPGFDAGLTLNVAAPYRTFGADKSAEGAPAIIPQSPLCVTSPCISGKQVQCCLNINWWPPNISANCTASNC